jgi:hypothetical protein
MGRGFARRRPFDFDFETIMRGEGGAVKRSQWWQGTTGGVTEHTKMADTLGSFVRPGDNLTLKPLPLRRPPTTRRRLSHHPPHTHAQRHAAVNGSSIYTIGLRYHTSSTAAIRVALASASVVRENDVHQAAAVVVERERATKLLLPNAV